MTVSDMNIASLLDVFDYALVLIYGLALDVFISGGCDTPRQKRLIAYLCPCFLVVQLLGWLALGELAVKQIYPLIVHLPLVLGYILALLMHLSHIVEKIAFPYLMIIQMIPILGMAPIVLSITGDISSARITIAAILTFYPVSTNTLAGFKSVGRERHELMRSYGTSKFQLYTKMLIPSAMSYFFTGLKISAPMAITASILVDTLQGGNGLGCMLSQSLKGSMTRFVFWDIVIFSAVIGVLSFYLMGVIERAITPAKRKAKKKAQ